MEIIINAPLDQIFCEFLFIRYYDGIGNDGKLLFIKIVSHVAAAGNCLYITSKLEKKEK